MLRTPILQTPVLAPVLVPVLVLVLVLVWVLADGLPQKHVWA
jgi:hypothetical protein